MWQNLLDFMLGFIRNISQFASWLTTDIDGLGVSPLAFFSLGTFVFIIGLWVVKLINPLS